MSADPASVAVIRTEREIEEAIAHEPWMLYPNGPRDGWRKSDLRVARQVSLEPAGVADLVIVHPDGFSVVEVKRDRISDAAVGQALRYASALAYGLNQTPAGHRNMTIGCHVHYKVDIRLVAAKIGFDASWSARANHITSEVRENFLVPSGLGIFLFEWVDGRAVPVPGCSDFEHYGLAKTCNWLVHVGATLWTPRPQAQVAVLRPLTYPGAVEDPRPRRGLAWRAHLRNAYGGIRKRYRVRPMRRRQNRAVVDGW